MWWHAAYNVTEVISVNFSYMRVDDVGEVRCPLLHILTPPDFPAKS